MRPLVLLLLRPYFYLPWFFPHPPWSPCPLTALTLPSPDLLLPCHWVPGPPTALCPCFYLLPSFFGSLSLSQLAFTFYPPSLAPCLSPDLLLPSALLLWLLVSLPACFYLLPSFFGSLSLSRLASTFYPPSLAPCPSSGLLLPSALLLWLLLSLPVCFYLLPSFFGSLSLSRPFDNAMPTKAYFLFAPTHLGILLLRSARGHQLETDAPALALLLSFYLSIALGVHRYPKHTEAHVSLCYAFSIKVVGPSKRRSQKVCKCEKGIGSKARVFLHLCTLINSSRSLALSFLQPNTRTDADKFCTSKKSLSLEVRICVGKSINCFRPFECVSDKDSSGPEDGQLVCMASLVQQACCCQEVD
eukprot:1160170-Pelagomonas_calceolata.AAC.9